MWDVELFDRLISDAAVETDNINSNSSTSQVAASEIAISKIGPLIWENSKDCQLVVEVFAENIKEDVVQSVDLSATNEGTIEESERVQGRPSRNCLKTASTVKKLSAVQLFQELGGSKGSPTLNPHSLIAPYAYGDPIGPAPTEIQPFSIVVHPQVGLICDIHAHLCDAEVIGLLAGKYDEGRKSLYIQAPFPCTAVDRVDDDGSTDVELDPEAEWKARETISNMGMQVVGWYHSHPRFRPDPSLTDICNQEQHQCMEHKNNTYIEPFVGLIVSTFDPSLPTYESHHQWFHVHPYLAAGSKRTIYMPMLLNVAYAKLSSTTVSSKSIEYLEEKFDSIPVESNEEPSDNKGTESQTTANVSTHPHTASEEHEPLKVVKGEPSAEPSDIQKEPATKDNLKMKRKPRKVSAGGAQMKPSLAVNYHKAKVANLVKMLLDLGEDASAIKSLDRNGMIGLIKSKSENVKAAVSVTEEGDRSIEDCSELNDTSSSKIAISSLISPEDVIRSDVGVANECKEGDARIELDSEVVPHTSDAITTSVTEEQNIMDNTSAPVEISVPETDAAVIAIPVDSVITMDTQDDIREEFPSVDAPAAPGSSMPSSQKFPNTAAAIANTENNAELPADTLLPTNDIDIPVTSETKTKKTRKKVPVPIEVTTAERSKRVVKARDIYDDSIYRKKSRLSSDPQLPAMADEENQNDKRNPTQKKPLPHMEVEASVVASEALDQDCNVDSMDPVVVGVNNGSSSEENDVPPPGNQEELPDQSNSTLLESVETVVVKEETSATLGRESSIVDRGKVPPDQSCNSESVPDNTALAVLNESGSIVLKEGIEKNNDEGGGGGGLGGGGGGGGGEEKDSSKTVRERKEKKKSSDDNIASSRERRPLARKNYEDFSTDMDFGRKKNIPLAKKRFKSSSKSADNDESLKTAESQEENPTVARVPSRGGTSKRPASSLQIEEESDSGKPSRQRKVVRKKQSAESVSKLAAAKSKKGALDHSHDDDEPKPKKKAFAPRKGRGHDAPAPEKSYNVNVISLLRDGSQLFTPHGRKVLFSVAPEYRYLTLCIISLGCYYRQAKYKVELSRKWKDHTKLEKLRVSATVWAKYLGLSNISLPASSSSTTTVGGVKSIEEEPAGLEGQGLEREQGGQGVDGNSMEEVVVEKTGREKTAVRTRSALTALSSSDDGSPTVRLIPELIEFLRLCWEPLPAPVKARTASATTTTKGTRKKKDPTTTATSSDMESAAKKKRKLSAGGRNRAN